MQTHSQCLELYLHGYDMLGRLEHERAVVFHPRPEAQAEMNSDLLLGPDWTTLGSQDKKNKEEVDIL